MGPLRICELMETHAVSYRVAAKESIARNAHLTGCSVTDDLEPEFVDALLVDFINSFGANHGIDYALSVDDLKPKPRFPTVLDELRDFLETGIAIESEAALDASKRDEHSAYERSVGMKQAYEEIIKWLGLRQCY